MATGTHERSSPVLDWKNRTVQMAKGFGLEPALMYQVCLGREIAAGLFKTEIASTETLKEVHAFTGASVFCFKESGAITGFLALLPLRPAALAALENCTFDALAIDLALVARPQEPAGALYVWGFAALTKTASRSVLAGLAAIQGDVFGAVPRYARVASEKGHWILRNKMAFRPIVGGEPSFVWAPPRHADRCAA